MDLKNILGELEQALYSRYRQAWIGNQTRGALDPRRCYRALGGSADVFRRKDVREERRSAVSLVVDGSDSMNWNGGAFALEKMVNGFQDVFANSAVNYEVTSFVTYEPSDNAKFRKKAHTTEKQDAFAGPGYGYKRWNSSSLGQTRATSTEQLMNVLRDGKAFRFKSFGTQSPKKTRLGELCRKACIGGTADAQVYRHAMQRLAKQEESTKLLIFLGDGEGQGIEFIARVSAEAREHGIITLGIGLGRDAEKAVKPYAFDAHVQVSDVSQLKLEAFRTATKTINEIRKERCK